LVGANDDVAKSRAVLKHENSVGLAALSLATARGATVVLEGSQHEDPTKSQQQGEPRKSTRLDVFAVESLAACNVLRLTQRLRASGSRKSGLGETGESGGQGCQESDEAGGMHLFGIGMKELFGTSRIEYCQERVK